MTDLTGLWGKRAAAFSKEAAIYWSYAARSGLSAFLLFFFIIGAYLYFNILKQLPVSYPYWRITTPLLAAAVAFAPYRTFLKPADQVFLMPAELKLRRYWLNSAIYSYVFQAAWSIGALLLIWPLYLHCEGTQAVSFPAAIFSLLFVKAAALDSRISQSKLLFRIHRVVLELLRWTASALFAFMVLTEDYFIGALVFFIFYLLQTAAVRYLPKHRIPWEAWIRKEADHLKFHYTFFSWFADVPKLPARPKARTFLAGLVNRLPFDRNETYRYLYAKSFLRSELFGITIRILTVAVLLFVFVENAVAEPLIYAATLLMTAATVSSMDQMHRYSFWLELYPVARTHRAQAIVSTALWALAGWNTVVGAAFVILHQERLHALAAVAAGYLFIFYYVYIPLRKRASVRDD
jgi:ABC-2 type transport system permease protein